MKQLTGNVKNFETLMKAIEMASTMPIRFAGAGEIGDNVNGYCDYGNKEIVIREGMSEVGTVKTALHEIGHALLHDVDVMLRLGRWKDRNIREIEAESISFKVCRHFGIDTFDFSYLYISDFGDGISMEELQKSLKDVNTVSRHLTAILEDNIRFLQEIRIDDILFQEDSLVLKITQPSADTLSYMIVEGVEREELLAQLNSYHNLCGEKGNMAIHTFLEGQGAKLIHWYDFHGLALEHPVDFFDMAYDYEAGVTDAAQLPETEQAMMFMDRMEYMHPVFDERDRELVLDYAAKIKDIQCIKEFIREFAVRMELFNMQDKTNAQGAIQQGKVNIQDKAAHPDMEGSTPGKEEAGHEMTDYETAESERLARTYGRWEENRINEDFFLNNDRNCFAVYQIDRNGKGRAYHYMGIEVMEKYQLSIDRGDYQMAWCDVLEEQDTLESLFEKFNLAHPQEFDGFSMSVSDVVAFKQDGKVRTYFVDSFGFRELHGFIRQAERKTIRQEPKKTGTKQSVLEALRNRQARIKMREKEQGSGRVLQEKKQGLGTMLQEKKQEPGTIIRKKRGQEL